MSAKVEARETAYRTWCECGQNLSETERRLNRDCGLPVSRQTLTEWRDKYDWPGRAARAEAAVAIQDAATNPQSFLSALLEQKERYEEYFKTLPIGKIDNQALFAYSNILKTLVDLSAKAQSVATQAAVDSRREIESDEDALAALEEVISTKLNRMLANPETVSFAAIKDVKQTLDLLRDMRAKAKCAEKDGGPSTTGLTPEAAEAIRKNILGIR